MNTPIGYVEVTDHMFVPFILCNLRIFPGSSPIGDLPQSYSSPLVAMFPFSFSLFPPPIHTIRTIQLLLWWPHAGLISLIPASMFSFPSFYSILLCFIHHRLYVHIFNFSLVFKVTKTIKELIWVLLFISLRSDKQDRISQSLIYYSFTMHTAWHSAWRAVLFMLFVGLLQYQYIITFFDDFTSYGWSTMLHIKNAILQAAKHFLSMVSTQYDTKVKGWMSDARGEYRSEAFDKLLADNGITAY